MFSKIAHSKLMNQINHIMYIVLLLMGGKVKHMRCEQLLCSTTPKSNIRPYCDNLIVKINCYDKEGLIVNIVIVMF